MSEYPSKLPGFAFRDPDDDGDVKLLSDVHERGWHVVGVHNDEGPDFSFTVGLYLRTLQPEILIMGVPAEPSHRVLNAIGDYLMDGGTLTPETKYSGFVDGRDVLFRRIHQNQFHEHLGYANWFYRHLGSAFPALQCIWPDLDGRFPDEDDFDTRFIAKQTDLSQPRI